MALSVAEREVDMAQRCRWRISVEGTVQGVGFRPFVHRHAVTLGIAGWVANSAQGVIIEIEGRRDQLDTLVNAIRDCPPANAQVTRVALQKVALRNETVFVVRESDTVGTPAVPVAADLATCADCLEELFDPANRRFRYPFINCTQCGPRYSIVEDVPYDRSRTSMRHFAMCGACRQEYEDPANRRFHAEPNACAQCGPHIELWDQNADVLGQHEAALAAAVTAIRDGRIVAVKGIGGFHLMVDAGNEASVRRLRAVKQREQKPFAVMFANIDQLREYCVVSPAEQVLLCSPSRPIVLLRKSGAALAASVTVDSPRLGTLLPYTPLHHLLMREINIPVVATSGNVCDEPIVADEHEALQRLGRIADLFLVHDRPIVRALDDSVAQVVLGGPQILRRARGYVPAPVTTDKVAGGVVAFGSHLKSTVAVTCDAGTVLSQHLGDLVTPRARDAHDRATSDLVRLFAAQPRVAVSDLHPDYASSRAAQAAQLPVLAVQHHVAHVAACMAEHSLVPPLLGVAWDGSGFGADGTVWGGEFLAIDESGWRRVAHLRPFRLPGGEAAVREPARSALGLLFAAFGERTFEMTHLAPVAHFSGEQRAVLRRMLARNINAPMASSVGRLFDAFAALCGLCQRASYESQAAVALEWCAPGEGGTRRYSLPLRETASGPLLVDWEPALNAALADLGDGVAAGAVSESLHDALAHAIASVAQRFGASRVVLSGGCFQNVRLTEKSVNVLHAAGRQPFWHQRVPPNDGAIAFGQAAWAGWHPIQES